MPDEKPGQIAKRQKKNYGFFSSSGGDDDPGWILTYADMTTLLMTFFIFLLSISSPDPKKYEEMMRRVGDALGGGEGAFEAVEEETLESIMKKIEGYIENENLTDDIVITKDPRGIVIYAGSFIAFESGETELLEATEIFLKNFSKILKKSSYKIIIEGHTDDVPFQSEKFPSNWELSANRAGAVVRFLINTGNISPSRLIPSGYAGFKPRFPSTPENRVKNQRIEIVVLREKF
tara:strand:+ start:13773 stop:14474 length:702 start_codon:yes stop_codon:yes gene_type:complete